MRLTRITTRTGDQGRTGLGDGQRVSKCCARIETIGEIDALNVCVGSILGEPLPAAIAADVERLLTAVQSDLFSVGGELSIPGHAMLDATRVRLLDDAIGRWNAALPPLAEFILPRGTRAAMQAHAARTACRRAERRLVALHEAEPTRPELLAYLNRLSDLLFVLARALNRAAGVADTLWERQPPGPSSGK